MYRFGKSSAARLGTCHMDLIDIFCEAIESSPIDFGISSGMRTSEEQNALFNDGLSKCDGYVKKSKHQSGLAVDIFAYVDGKASYDVRHLCMLAGHIIGTANRLGFELRWGGDWDSDRNLDDQSFIDMPHFELVV